jgi:hypothetical protein
MIIPRALKFVRYDRVEDHYRQGWVMSFPNAAMHHHHYGCELAWLCGCPVPGGFQVEDSTHTERGAHERSTAGA